MLPPTIISVDCETDEDKAEFHEVKKRVKALPENAKWVAYADEFERKFEELYELASKITDEVSAHTEEQGGTPDVIFGFSADVVMALSDSVRTEGPEFAENENLESIQRLVPIAGASANNTANPKSIAVLHQTVQRKADKLEQKADFAPFAQLIKAMAGDESPEEFLKKLKARAATDNAKTENN